MPSYHIYLVASLPMLHFGAKAPFSFEAFLSVCKGLIPEEEVEILSSVSIDGIYQYERAHPALKRWYDYDTTLRNELVRIRASRKRLDPSKYIKQDGYTDPALAHLVTSAYRNPSILEAERLLDQERWRALDEMAFGHYFDISFLIIYAIKLKILLKWTDIEMADKPKLVEELLRRS